MPLEKIVQVKIAKQSFRFFQDFMPFSMHFCVKDVEHIPKSKFMKICLKTKKGEILKKKVEEFQLLTDMNDQIAKDLKNIINVIKS